LFGRGKLSNNLLQLVISNVWFPALVAESPATAFNVFNGQVESKLSRTILVDMHMLAKK
jgi:hypothetical protein